MALKNLKYAIVDPNYSDLKWRGVGANWLEWELARRDIKHVHPLEADIILFSILSPKEHPRLKTSIKKYWNGKAKLILGGAGCYSPAVFENFVDLICVGEGSDFMDVLLTKGYEAAKELPEVWIKGETRKVIPNENFPWEVPPLNCPDGTVRLFGSRGCKMRCYFCQTSFTSPYRVNPNSDVLQRQVDEFEKKKIKFAIVSNDAADVTVRINKKQEFISGTFKNLKRMKIDKTVTKTIRVGVEGVSERLRKSLGKPVNNEELLKLTHNAIENGVSVRWCFIVGLPGEEKKDYEELQLLLNETIRLRKSLVLCMFHAFIPECATPLGILPLVDQYLPHYQKIEKNYFRGMNYTGRIHFTKPAGYPTRLKTAMASMCSKEPQLRKGWFEVDNPNWRVQYPLTPDQLRHKARLYLKRLKKF